jgi:hypothetical protein
MGKAAEAAKADAAKKEAGGDKKKPWEEKKDDKGGGGGDKEKKPGFGQYADAAAKAVGLGDLAGLSKIAGPAAVAALAYQAKETGLAAAKLYQNENLPESVRRRAILRTLPGGETALDIGDTISGRARGMARVEELRAILAAQTEQRVSLERGNIAARNEAAPFQGRAYAYMGQEAVAAPYVDRSTAAGEQEYQRQQRLVPVRQRQQAAGMALESAQFEEKQAKDEMGRAAARVQDIQSRLDRAEAEEQKRADRPGSMLRQIAGRTTSASFALGGIGIIADQFGFTGDIRDKYTKGRPTDVTRAEGLVRIEDLENQLRAAKEDKRAADQRVADKEVNRSRAGEQKAVADVAATKRVEAEIAREKAMNAMTASSKIGGNREAALQAIEARRYINRVGIENAPADVIEQARSLYPQEIEAKVRDAGQKSPLYAQAAELGEGIDVPKEPLRDLKDKAKGAFQAFDKQAQEGDAEALKMEFEAARKASAEQLQAMQNFLATVLKSQEDINKAIAEADEKLKRAMIGRNLTGG